MNKNKGQLPKLWKECSVLQCSSISTNTELFANCTFVLCGQCLRCNCYVNCTLYTLDYDARSFHLYEICQRVRFIIKCKCHEIILKKKNKKFVENMNANEKNVELNEITNE